MAIQPFTQEDFAVFTIPGLDQRMTALIEKVRPKLEAIGGEIAPYLSALCGEEMHAHVARHARRKVNPPNDSWVAWANNKRGYKAHPHFEVGLWSTHLYIQFAIIYESTNKSVFADHLQQELTEVQALIPPHFFWSEDHISPRGIEHNAMTEDHFTSMVHHLKHVKKAEVMCGLNIDSSSEVLRDGDALHGLIEQTFSTLMPLYKMSF